MAREKWEKAEELVRNLTGGWRTPGSGNKRLKGDVRVGNSDWVLEVKQTAKSSISIQAQWFRNLLREAGKAEVGLVIFFDLRGYWYEFVGRGSGEPWESKIVHEDSLPEQIHFRGTLWELRELVDLRNLS